MSIPYIVLDLRHDPINITFHECNRETQLTKPVNVKSEGFEITLPTVGETLDLLMRMFQAPIEDLDRPLLIYAVSRLRDEEMIEQIAINSAAITYIDTIRSRGVKFAMWELPSDRIRFTQRGIADANSVCLQLNQNQNQVLTASGIVDLKQKSHYDLTVSTQNEFMLRPTSLELTVQDVIDAFNICLNRRLLGPLPECIVTAMQAIAQTDRFPNVLEQIRSKHLTFKEALILTNHTLVVLNFATGSIGYGVQA